MWIQALRDPNIAELARLKREVRRLLGRDSELKGRCALRCALCSNLIQANVTALDPEAVALTPSMPNAIRTPRTAFLAVWIYTLGMALLPKRRPWC